MDSFFNFKLSEEKPLSSFFVLNGIDNFLELFKYVHNLPYGRISNRDNLKLVYKEQRGTCSSKHALLKQVAIENKFEDLSLWIGIYRMNSKNTFGVKEVLNQYQIDYIPEAHCYLKFQEHRIDITFPDSLNLKFQDDLIQEIEILPAQVGTFKIDYHQSFLNQWLIDENLEISLEDIWKIREECIFALQHKKT